MTLLAPANAGPIDRIVDHGVVQHPTKLYRVTVDNYLASGAENFSVLQQGTNQIGGPQDIDALVAYLSATYKVTKVTLRPERSRTEPPASCTAAMTFLSGILQKPIAANGDARRNTAPRQRILSARRQACFPRPRGRGAPARLDTGFVSFVTTGETLVQSEPLPFDHRGVVAGVCCLLGSRRRGREAQHE